MHAAGIIHGDLTTSNVMLRNPSWALTKDNKNNSSWIPQLVLIDFGLATSTAPVQVNDNNNNKLNKQQHNAEDKAVDLYML
jgi:tRNA A-37 threonylcarbamoyl transferase component Bud32